MKHHVHIVVDDGADERRVDDRAGSGRRRAGPRSGTRPCRRRRCGRRFAGFESSALTRRVPRKPAAPVTSTFIARACYRSPRDQSTQGRHRHRSRARASAKGSRSRCCGGDTRSCSPDGAQPLLEAALAESGEDAARGLVVPTDVGDAASVRPPVRGHARGVRTPGPAVQQRRHQRPRRRARRADGRAVAGGRGREPHRAVPLHAAGVPADEGSAPDGRTDHQQRIHLGARAAPQLRAVYRDEARRSPVSRNRRRSTAASTTSPAGRSTSATPRRT